MLMVKNNQIFQKKLIFLKEMMILKYFSHFKNYKMKFRFWEINKFSKIILKKLNNLEMKKYLVKKKNYVLIN
jgi:hypothetical protein